MRIWLGVALISGATAGCGKAEEREAAPVQPAWKYNPQYVLEPQPPIENAPMFQAATVDRDLNPSELVLGVEIAGDARAYPINMLTGPSREIINDVVGGTPIAATW